MAAENNEFAPYAPPNNIVTIIRQQHTKGLPETIDKDVLLRLSVSESLATRVLQALRFLGLVDEEDRQTDEFKRLKKVSDEEYPDFLSDLLRNAYQKVFEIVDVASADERALHNAFRVYEPSGQRGRMVTLFYGLCREAGLVEESSLPRSTPVRRTAVKKTTQPQTRKTTFEVADNKPPSADTRNDRQENPMKSPGSPSDSQNEKQQYPLLYAMLKQLPPDGKWTTKRRDQWIAAMTANVDLLIDVSEVEEPKQPQTAMTL